MRRRTEPESPAAVRDAQYRAGVTLPAGTYHVVLMHRLLGTTGDGEIVFNGELTTRSIAPVYSFAFRLAHRFDGPAMFGRVDAAPLARGFWVAFFEGATPAGRRAPVTSWWGSKSSY